MIDFGDLQIFEGATTYPVIFVGENSASKEDFPVSVLNSAGAADFQTNVNFNKEFFEYNDFSDETWVISSKREKDLLHQLNEIFESLGEFVHQNANYGIKTGLSEAFQIDLPSKNDLIVKDPKSSEIVYPLLRGRDIKKWTAPIANTFLIATFPSLNLEIDDYPSIKNYFIDFGKSKLEQSGERGSRKKTSNRWFETQDTIAYWKDFKKPKIMYQKFQVKPCFIYDKEGYYCNDSMWIIPTENKGLVGILNSKMGWWLITKYCTQIQNGCQLIWKYFSQIPIPEFGNELDLIVEKMIDLHKSIDLIINSFSKLLDSKFNIEKFSRKLQNWHEITFAEFLKELKKKKVTLTLSEEAEWMQYFEEQKAKALAIKTEIDKTDTEIDQLVYELYGLTDEEIAIVEAS